MLFNTKIYLKSNRYYTLKPLPTQTEPTQPSSVTHGPITYFRRRKFIVWHQKNKNVYSQILKNENSNKKPFIKASVSLS